MKKRLVFATLASLIAFSAHAGPDDIRRAAEQGDASQQLELGVLYEYGFGLKQNTVPALAWYILAAEQGNAQALKHRDALQARMKPERVSEAQRQADEWRKAIAVARANRPTAPTTAPVVPVANPAENTDASPAGATPTADAGTATAGDTVPATNEAPADPASAIRPVAAPADNNGAAPSPATGAVEPGAAKGTADTPPATPSAADTPLKTSAPAP
jgi:hypothetical protein